MYHVPLLLPTVAAFTIGSDKTGKAPNSLLTVPPLRCGVGEAGSPRPHERGQDRSGQSGEATSVGVAPDLQRLLCHDLTLDRVARLGKHLENKRPERSQLGLLPFEHEHVSDAAPPVEQERDP